VDSVLYPTLNRHLRGYSAQDFRRELATACARHAKLGPASLVLNDVSKRCVSRPTPATVPRARVLQ
jgi:hypothetical protein